VQITVDRDDGEVSPVNTGIPQRSPVSPIVFAIYLSCLFPHIVNTLEGVEGIPFGDDVGWWVSGKDIGELRHKMEKCTLLSQQWAQNNAVVFDIDETEVILLSRRKRLNQAFNTGIQVAPGVKKSFNRHATRWLEIFLDSHLTLKEHHKK
jgi:hypothetical protein